MRQRALSGAPVPGPVITGVISRARARAGAGPVGREVFGRPVGRWYVLSGRVPVPVAGLLCGARAWSAAGARAWAVCGRAAGRWRAAGRAVAGGQGVAGGRAVAGGGGVSLGGGGLSGGAPSAGGIRGRVPHSRPRNTWARSRSMPPPAPDAFSARARALIRAIAAAAPIPGSWYPASVAVPSSSGYRQTFARASDCWRRRSAPSGSTAITARRSAARSPALVSSPARGRIWSSTVRASCSASRAVASAISRARGRSIVPAASAAPVAASRHLSVIARSSHHSALQRDITRPSDTSAAASSGTRAGLPLPSTVTFGSRAADRDAICATAASSPACAHDASRRHDAATPASAPSSSPAGSAAASHPARPGPAGKHSATRPAATVSGISRTSAASSPSSTAS